MVCALTAWENEAHWCPAAGWFLREAPVARVGISVARPRPTTMARASLLSIDTSDINLVRAQLAAFGKQVPLLYSVLCINAVLCIFSFHQQAPAWLGLWLPGLVVTISVVRTVIWLRSKHKVLSDDQARRRLRGVVGIGGALTVLTLIWFLGLFLVVDTQVLKIHVAYSLAVTIISCMTCLMHLRPAMIMVGGSSSALCVLLLLSGDTRLAIVGVNQVLVLVSAIYVLAVASRDFDRMIQLSGENARLANLDSLTELPNRRAFFEHVGKALQTAGTSARPFAVAVLDIDGFKAINDLHGHVTGDRLLVETGHRLRALCGANAIVHRLGGDEFALIVSEARDPAAILSFGEQICAALAEPFQLPGATAKVSASVGFAIHPIAGRSAELLYERADYALYFAKSHRRGQPVIFSETHESDIRKQSTIEQALRNADLEQQLSLHFQPLFDVERGRPTAFEALARWKHPTLGPVPPNIFIPVAERTDLIFRLTHVLLRKALAAARTWPAPIRISFNLSMRDIASADSIAMICAIVRSSGIEPQRIEFEITESALMADFTQALESVRILRDLGARISLDDFGTGYSSLSHVHRLPLDKINVDRSFIVDIESRSSSRDILKTVIDLCSNLNIACVVEGTETARQIEILRRLGFRSMQGYYFARPMPLADIPAFLAGVRPGSERLTVPAPQ